MEGSVSFSPQKFREIVFQLVYSSDFGSDSDVQGMMMSQLAVSRRIMKAADALKERVLEKREEIDAKIRQHSQSYDFDRIPRVERNIVRLGIYELLFVKEVPGKVAIAESIRLARKFATKEAATFVNALMDSVYHSLEQEGISSDGQLTSSSV